MSNVQSRRNSRDVSHLRVRIAVNVDHLRVGPFFQSRFNHVLQFSSKDLRIVWIEAAALKVIPRPKFLITIIVLIIWIRCVVTVIAEIRISSRRYSVIASLPSFRRLKSSSWFFLYKNESHTYQCREVLNNIETQFAALDDRDVSIREGENSPHDAFRSQIIILRWNYESVTRY